jgi:HPt (histidine-containing phosphotransfer) domain-containing protein
MLRPEPKGNSMSPTSQDWIYSTLGTDPDLGELVEMFVSEMPARLESLLSLYDSGNMSELRRLAHQIKGAAGSYGFHSLSPAAARLEASLKSERPEEQIKHEIDELVALCSRIRAGSAQ